MRIVLIILFAGLSGWLYYDRGNLQKEITRLNDANTASQGELDKTKKNATLTMAELVKVAPERAALLGKLNQQQMALAQKQAELDRLSKKSNWLQDEIDHRGDPLAPGKH